MSKVAIIFLTFMFMHPHPWSYGDETPVEKLENEYDKTKTEAKKTARRMKRNLRNDTGQGSVKKDVEDKAKDFKEDAETQANKLKRKVD